MDEMSSEPLSETDHDVDDSFAVTHVDAFCGEYTATHEGVGDVGFDAVVLTITGDDSSGVAHDHRFVIPIERWSDVNRLVVHAIRSFEMGKAFEAARDLDALTDELLTPDDAGLGILQALEEFAGGTGLNPGDHGRQDDAVEPSDGFDDAEDDDVDAPGEDDTGPDPAEVELAWHHLTTNLAGVLEVLEPGHFLVLSGPGNRFVQIAVGREDTRLETVANQFLAPDDRMSFDDLDLLAEVGWEPPAYFRDDERHPDDASPNHHIELPAQWRPHGTSLLMVKTLRHIHRVHSPRDLSYRAFGGRSDNLILLPTLGLLRDNG